MSSIRRIIDLAKSNLNALLERAAETADPRRRLANIPDAELEAELARRRAARAQDEKLRDAKARIDGARIPQDRAERERMAREREARVRAERERREAAARERARQSAASSGWRSSSGPRPSGAGPRPGAAPPPRPRGRDPELARYYDRLELPYGTSFEEVKSQYRKLMRKYHPDLHGHKSPEKLKAATEVTQALTQAYNELEKVLLGGPNRK